MQVAPPSHDLLVVGLCLAACFVRNVRFHVAFALAALAYFASCIARHCGALQ
jgi:hypothetical protein